LMNPEILVSTNLSRCEREARLRQQPTQFWFCKELQNPHNAATSKWTCWCIVAHEHGSIGLQAMCATTKNTFCSIYLCLESSICSCVFLVCTFYKRLSESFLITITNLLVCFSALFLRVLFASLLKGVTS
jgi:hypothetical protein